MEGGNRVELRNITPGRDFGNSIEIVAGIKPTDWVIENPSDSLISGETVRQADANQERQNSEGAGIPQ